MCIKDRYRSQGGVLLVPGDPVGHPGALPARARDLRAFADVRGLRLGVVGAGGSSRRLFAAVGLRSLYLGDEAIVETAGFTLEGRRMKKVRQAILYALDRDTVAKTIGLGLGEANYYHVVPGQVGYSDALPKNAYDPAKAKQLLTEAGFADGIDVQFDFTSRPEDTQNAQVYQQMLAKVGVRLTLQPSERVAWVNKTLAGNFEFGSYLSGVRPDPDLALGYRVATGGSGNYAAWTDPAVDAALQEGRSTYDLAKRQAAYETVQQIMFDAAYYGFVWRRPGTFAMTSALKGFQTPLQGYFTNSMQLWLDR